MNRGRNVEFEVKYGLITLHKLLCQHTDKIQLEVQ